MQWIRHVDSTSGKEFFINIENLVAIEVDGSDVDYFAADGKTYRVTAESHELAVGLAVRLTGTRNRSGVVTIV